MNTQAYIKKTPITDTEVGKCFQTGPNQRVNADAMRNMECELQELKRQYGILSNELLVCQERLSWIDENMSPEESVRLFNEEIEVGKLRDAVDEMLNENK